MPTSYYPPRNRRIKRLLLLPFLLFGLTASSQGLTGLWVGNLHNDSASVRKDQSFEIALTEYRGKVYGYSRSEFIINDTLYFILKRVKGTIKGDVCEVEDDEIISYNFRGKLDKGVRVTSTFRRNRADSTWYLDGTWKTNATKRFYSVSGKVQLEEEKDLAASKIFPHLEELNMAGSVAFYKDQKELNEYKPVMRLVRSEKVKTEYSASPLLTEEPSPTNLSIAAPALPSPSFPSPATDTITALAKVTEPAPVNPAKSELPKPAGSTEPISVSVNKQNNPGTDSTKQNLIAQSKQVEPVPAKNTNVEPTRPTGSTEPVLVSVNKQKNPGADNTKQNQLVNNKQVDPVQAKNNVAEPTMPTRSTEPAPVVAAKIPSPAEPQPSVSKPSTVPVTQAGNNISQPANNNTNTVNKPKPDATPVAKTAQPAPVPADNRKNEPVLAENKNGIPVNPVAGNSPTDAGARNAPIPEQAGVSVNPIPATPAITVNPMERSAVISGRKSEFNQEVQFMSDSLELVLYDNGEIDGDTVSVYLNGEMLMGHQGLKASAIKKTIAVPRGQESFTIVMFAESLGSRPPNTGLLVVHDGEETYHVRFSSDFQKSTGIVFRRKK